MQKGEKLNIVAHSHGNNAVKIYTNRKDARKIDTWVQLAAPHINSGKYETNLKNVKKQINVYSEADMVVPLAGGDDGSVWDVTKYGPASYIDRQSPNAINVDATLHPDSDRDYIINGGMFSTPYLANKERTGHSDMLNATFWNYYVSPFLAN